MNNRIATALYLIASAATIGIATYVAILAGLSLRLAGPAAFAFVFVLNGTVAYWYSARQPRSQGGSPPSFLRTIFAPMTSAGLRDEAPPLARLMVGAIAVLVGAFFVFCGVALAIDAEWSRISHPIAVVVICLIITGIGVALLYTAWRLTLARKGSAHVA